jgi:V/A-type H+-transporting ATPase subunit C
MAEAADEEAVLRVIAETPWRELFEDTGALADADRILDEEWTRSIQEMRALCPSDTVVELFVLEAEFQNYKSWLKGTLFDLPHERLGIGRFTDEDFERVSRGLSTPAWDLFAAGTARLNIEIDRETARPVTVDWIFDAELLGRYLPAAESIGSDVITECVRRMAQLRTAEVILRALEQHQTTDALQTLFVAALPERLTELAHQFLEASVDEQFDALGTLLDHDWIEEVRALDSAARRNEALAYEIGRVMLRLAEPATRVPFGPERVFAWLVALQNELRNLRIILGGKACRVEPAALKARMVLPGER